MLLVRLGLPALSRKIFAFQGDCGDGYGIWSDEVRTGGRQTGSLLVRIGGRFGGFPQVLQLIRGIDRTRNRVLSFDPVIQVQKPATVTAERERRHVDIGKNRAADGAAKDGSIVADRFGSLIHRSTDCLLSDE